MKRKSIAKFQAEFRSSRIPAFLGLHLLVRAIPFLALAMTAFGLYSLVMGQHSDSYLMAGTAAIGLPEVKAQFEDVIKPLRGKLESLAEDLEKDKKTLGTERKETKEKIDAVLTEMGEVKTRITAVEQKMVRPASDGDGEVKSLGQLVIESEEYKSLAGRGKGMAAIKVSPELYRKTAIVNATGQNQPLVPSDRRPGIIAPQLRRLRIRDLLNTVRTSSNLIEFTRESSFTNAAAPQGKSSSPQVYENVAKAESAMAFELVNEPVQTIAHWIPASKQVLADAPQLQGYIDGRLRRGLAEEEEDQLLGGTAAGGDLNGLITQATAYDTGLDVAGDTKIDTLRRAVLQAELAFHEVSAFVLNPEDWADIELKKDTTNQYIWASPSALIPASIWGRPVVSTIAVTQGDFLAGDFSSAVCDIYDREDVSVTLSTEHSDFFTKNMVAILCEERLALVVYKPGGLITGTYPASA